MYHFHKWTSLSIPRGTPLALSFDINGVGRARRANKPDDKHYAFAAEDIVTRTVRTCDVISPVDIRLVYNVKNT